MGKAYRLIQAELTLQDVIDIRENPNMRLTTSPFGVTPAQYEKSPPIYPGKAVAWKGAAGIDDMYRIFGEKPSYYNQEGKLYPAKCIAQKRWKEEHSEIK